eukprot:CAMPEP_0184711596 /NCGR_PEP_ID=MMETSP0314-20130426/2235_1 /TAXON_ID=38298 /ORGANISM="Rhodella maculata, Strain CCMP 736" /LENGTH=161 /DNA_ID=CAMNT_0027173771 /DNA_START=31 /DNA_END=516 /DNA_ORIENTATION=+
MSSTPPPPAPHYIHLTAPGAQFGHDLSPWVLLSPTTRAGCGGYGVPSKAGLGSSLMTPQGGPAEEERREKEKFDCPHCPVTFKHFKNIRTHVNVVHLGTKDHICHCGWKFGSRANLVNHRRAKHAENKRKDAGCAAFPCGECAKVFQSKAEVVNHAVFGHL